MGLSNKKDWFIFATCAGLTLAIYLLDLVLPLGVAGGVPYVAAVLIGSFSSDRRLVIGLAVAGSFCTIAGYVYSPHGAETWIVITNRVLALFAIWITAIVTFRWKIAQSTTRASEERYALVIAGTNDGIWERNISTGEVFRSPRYLQIVGYAPGELGPSREAILEMIHPEDLEKCKSAFQAHLETRVPYTNLEFRIRHKSGEYIWVSANAQAVWDRDGKVVRIAGSINDITERKRAAEDKAALEKQLRHAQKMEAVGTLAGGVAHDFNNIMQGIIGHVYLAREKVSPASAACVNLDQITRAVERGVGTVRQLLAFSRNEEPTRQAVRIERIVAEALALIRVSIPTTIELQLDLDGETATVSADATQIQQILMNLCSNAADAIGDEVGTIGIAVAEVNGGGGKDIRLTVSDTGCGMDAGTRERIFDPFFTTKDVGKGTGLGLATTHGIVHDHGGTIEVASAPGKGTTISVILPGLDTTAPGAAAAPAADASAVDTGHILLVDDDSMTTESMRLVLESFGYTVTAAPDSAAAVKIFASDPDRFDLVITDYSMPDITGVGLARKLVGIRPSIPIILCTGYADKARQEREGNSGIWAFVEKPVGTVALGQAVYRALNGGMR
jgi:PAS domain S-box-containing protein